MVELKLLLEVTICYLHKHYKSYHGAVQEYLKYLLIFNFLFRGDKNQDIENSLYIQYCPYFMDISYQTLKLEKSFCLLLRVIIITYKKNYCN